MLTLIVAGRAGNLFEISLACGRWRDFATGLQLAIKAGYRGLH
jgi:hypothetical protein